MSRRKQSEITRREFLSGTVAGIAAAGLPAWFTRAAIAAELERDAGAPRRIGPNDTIVIGVIGPGGSRGGYQQGLNDTRAAAAHHGTHIAAVCDLDELHRNEAAAVFGPDTAKYHDFRDLLARPDIDAVVIGTPDHWHSHLAIAAMKAGKDVYCEKPLTLTIDEGIKLTRVARETGRVFQTGSQQRSDPRFRLACELVRNGRLGKIKQVHTNLPTGPTGGPFPVVPVPAGFDWDMWQGQTMPTDYVKERSFGNFRWWYEYSGGMVTDWGAHHNDIAQWGLGTERSGPIAVESVGKLPPPCHTCYNTPAEFDITYTYPNDITLICSNKGENGVQFDGENGTIFVSRGLIRASDPRLLTDPLPAGSVQLYVSNDHMGNFLDCIRARKQTICPAEIGHRSVSVCHLGNISLRLGGRRLEWDPARQKFKNDSQANGMLHRAQRKPWTV